MTKYGKYKDELNFKGIEFPVSLDKIKKFEQLLTGKRIKELDEKTLLFTEQTANKIKELDEKTLHFADGKGIDAKTKRIGNVSDPKDDKNVINVMISGVVVKKAEDALSRGYTLQCVYCRFFEKQRVYGVP